jgi:cytochrome c oxidase assembly protein subunit 15
VATAIVLALCVVMLGAYTRLTHAGLGCPDWPGCYGHLVLPSESTVLNSSQHRFPTTPFESRKAWTEMAHRYAAGTLALLIFIIGTFALRQRLNQQKTPLVIPVLLALFIVFQAALGMWTVTMKLLPVVVMGHLLGGILIFSCLCVLGIQLSGAKPVPSAGWRVWIGLGVLIVFCQIALGGWVSANYAGIACVGFPQCNGQWLPTLHFSQGFHLLSPVGANYQGGLLDSSARVTIQVVHRLGALVTALYCLSLSACLLARSKSSLLRWAALFVILLVMTQITLGIVNVVYLLPLGVAVAHNGVAALLMATMLVMFSLTFPRRSHEFN